MLSNQKYILLVALLFFSININAQNFDIDLLKSINENETEFKNSYSNITTGSVHVIGFAAPAGFFTAGLIKHDKKLQKDAAYMLGAYLTTAIVTQGTKRIINRNRPFQDHAFIIRRVNESDGRSFPSGHTSSAFSTATSLSLYYPKWYVIAPSYLYAASVGWARMYQGVHYPTDVLGGVVVGAGTAWLSYKVQQWHDKNVEKKNKTTRQKITL